VGRLQRCSCMARDRWSLAVFVWGRDYGFYSVAGLGCRIERGSAVRRLHGRGQRADTVAAQREYDSIVEWNRTKNRPARRADDIT
jgi:hypothetical protein